MFHSALLALTGLMVGTAHADDDLEFDLEGYYRTRGHVFWNLYDGQEEAGRYMQQRLRLQLAGLEASGAPLHLVARKRGARALRDQRCVQLGRRRLRLGAARLLRVRLGARGSERCGGGRAALLHLLLVARLCRDAARLSLRRERVRLRQLLRVLAQRTRHLGFAPPRRLLLLLGGRLLLP